MTIVGIYTLAQQGRCRRLLQSGMDWRRHQPLGVVPATGNRHVSLVIESMAGEVVTDAMLPAVAQ